MTADEMIRRLGLKPMAGEGGWFVETWREMGASAATGAGTATGAGALAVGTRPVGTAIYYLITPKSFSEMHRLPGAEIFHFYLGDPAEMLMLEPGGKGRVITLGNDLDAGMHPQVVVPGAVWQGTRLAPGGVWSLMGTTMAPGFFQDDYERGGRAELVAGWPEFRREIEQRTRA